MKHILITTIAAVLLVGCGKSQQSAPPVEAKPVAEASQPEPTTAKAPDISIHDASKEGNIEAVKQHIASGTDVDAKDDGGWRPLHAATKTKQSHKEIVELLIAKGADVNVKGNYGLTPLHSAARHGHKEIAELLIAKGADVNAKDENSLTPLDWAVVEKHTEIADLLRKHGGKTGEELKAEGK